MLQGLYVAASGIVNIEDRQAVIANNVANASTVGFRRETPIQKGFYPVFSQGLSRSARFDGNKAPGGGVKIVEAFTDTSPGTISSTDDPLNVSLSGPGFLAVQTPQGERFTRAGNMKVDKEGQLASPDGYKILGAGGGIDVQGSSLTISQDGTVRVDGAERGKLRIVEFTSPRTLAREGQSLFKASPTDLQQSTEAGSTTVAGKSLELSNVSAPNEMINMILGLRAYAANQKVINAMDETMTRVIDQVGSPT